jgi:1-acyl-sn-glycerol-3-phosphate acyltransferase
VYRFVIFWFRVFFHLFYRHSTEWEFNPKELVGAAIIAPNHVSYLDPPLISAAWPKPLHFFARRRLFQKGWLAWLLPRLNTHPVEQGQEIATMRLALSLLNEGKKIVVFPEGTRSESGQIGPMRSGVSFLSLRSGAPVIPCYIEGTYEAWPRTEKKPRVRGRKTFCRFGRPIFPVRADGTKLSKQEIIALIQAELERLERVVSKKR